MNINRLQLLHLEKKKLGLLEARDDTEEDSLCPNTMWMSTNLNEIITTHQNISRLQMIKKSSHVLHSYIESYPELWNGQMRATSAVRQTPVSSYSGLWPSATQLELDSKENKPNKENKQTHHGKYVSNWTNKSFCWYTVCLYFDIQTLIPKHKCINKIKLFHTLGSALVYAFSRQFLSR